MVSLSHLFYVDGAIFIGQWSELSIDTLVQVLECFYRASGLRINMCKSKIIGVNVEDGKIQNAASKLGCLVLKDSVYISWYEVLSYVLKTLESIRSRFFNGRDHKSRKASWAKWDNVLTSRDKGGLGVASLYALNRAVHGDDGKLDKDVIVRGQTCWTSIVKEARYLKGTCINVMDLIRLKLGNRDSSSFWEDKWYACGVIKELFPRLYALELHKHATVRMKLMAPSLDNSFCRRVRSGAEESQFNSMFGDCAGGSPHYKLMASKTITPPVIFLALNLLLFALASGCSTCSSPPTPKPNPSGATCPKDALKLGVCANVLGSLLGVVVGDPPVKPCCSLIEGLGINLNVQLSLSLFLMFVARKCPRNSNVLKSLTTRVCILPFAFVFDCESVWLLFDLQLG
uniref:RNA-directed DNA polymerase, eukaryota, reverse transcriptase zinc-binding domain protein n=1 Tax=Tanacetum cinerariifolium TaxID=118510 RepID=A0A699K0L5_TANCI|nr:RNA-directed DNA polymerase, eukaryota, reverse transcriptase zinc-binding domain protein [Tanacetum cinerariifolium]